MIDLPPGHYDIVTKILIAIVPDAEVLVFGSRAGGKPKDSSDLDLAIKASVKLEKTTLRKLQSSFEESNLPYRVDVVDWNGISREFRSIIEKRFEILIPAK